MSVGPSFLTGHLSGEQVTALVDGQASAGESRRAALHISECGGCARLVNREAWLKTRLSGLGAAMPVTSRVADLLDAPPAPIYPSPTSAFASRPLVRSRSRRTTAWVGAGAAAAVVAAVGYTTPMPLPTRAAAVSIVESVGSTISATVDSAWGLLRRSAH